MRGYNLVVIFIILFCSKVLTGQTLPVGMPVLEDRYRREQLLGLQDSLVSFAIRPLAIDSVNIVPFEKWDVNGSKGYWSILPITWMQQFNGSFPTGFNDGSMIPAKGYQTQISGGVAGQFGPLSFQMKPQYTYAENPAYPGLPLEYYPVVWKDFYSLYNNIDLPERIGKISYTRLDLGQSNIKLNYREFSVGVSNENLWWGPGSGNSLLMSNTAPGFLHFTLNTNKPFRTSIGSFEAQFIWGRLEGTDNNPTQVDDYLYGTGTIYAPKKDDWRQISGLTISFQPKLLPGLFVGFARTSQIYNSDVNRTGDVLPFFSKYSRGLGDTKPYGSPDRYTSMFFRWLLKESKAEIYFEYGNNDQSNTFGDFIKNPDAGRAYVAGVKKVFSLPKEGHYILGSLELTQLGQNDEKQIFQDVDSWYMDANVRHGYTHEGQMLGAGIGPGGELQSLEANWFNGMKSVGLQVDRFVHNQDFHFYMFSRSGDFRRNWVDLSLGLTGSWDYKGLLVNAKIAHIKSFNYYWFLPQEPGQPWWIKGLDRSNFHGSVGLSYFFK